MITRDRRGADDLASEIGSTDRSPSSTASIGEIPGGLDWQAFSARCFPGRWRHDVEVLIAYGLYRSFPEAAEEAMEEANGGLVTETAVETWEDEGGAAG